MSKSRKNKVQTVKTETNLVKTENKPVETQTVKTQIEPVKTQTVKATLSLGLNQSSKYDGIHYLGLKLLNGQTWQELADNSSLKFPREIFDSYNYGSSSSKRFRSKIQSSHTIGFEAIGTFNNGDFDLDLNKFMGKESQSKWFKLSDSVCIVRIQTNAQKCRYLIFNPLKLKSQLDSLTNMVKVEDIKAETKSDIVETSMIEAETKPEMVETSTVETETN